MKLTTKEGEAETDVLIFDPSKGVVGKLKFLVTRF